MYVQKVIINRILVQVNVTYVYLAHMQQVQEIQYVQIVHQVVPMAITDKVVVVVVKQVNMLHLALIYAHYVLLVNTQQKVPIHV